jgi:hypothetical protein
MTLFRVLELINIEFSVTAMTNFVTDDKAIAHHSTAVSLTPLPMDGRVYQET